LDYESTDRRASNYMSFEKSTQDLEYWEGTLYLIPCTFT
jgi:hypothetical protein